MAASHLLPINFFPVVDEASGVGDEADLKEAAKQQLQGSAEPPEEDEEEC